MRKKRIVCFVLLLPIAAFGDISQWQVQTYWDTLKPRMAEHVVVELLGEPLEKETTESCQIWYYQQKPERVGDKIIRPRVGFLRFLQADSAYLLANWKQPDWTVTAPYTEAQYLLEQQRIETQRKAEENRQQIQQQQQLRAEQGRQKAAERQALYEQRQEQLKQQQASRQQKIVEPTVQQKETPSAPPKEKGFGFDALHARYWFMVGGFFIVTAIILSIVMGFKYGIFK